MKKILVILAVLALAGAAHAEFTDDFDSNTAGNNYVWTQGDPLVGNNGWVGLYDEESFSMNSAYISAPGEGIGTTKGAEGLAGYSQSQAGQPWYYGQGAARDITGDTDGNAVTVSLQINMSGTPAAGGLEEGEVRLYLGQAAGMSSGSPPFPERHLFRITPTGNLSSFGTNWGNGAGWDFTSFEAGVAGVPDWTTWGWMEISIEVDKSANYAHAFIQDVDDATGAPIGTPYDLGQFPGGTPGVTTPFALEAAAFWIWDADGADWATTVDNITVIPEPATMAVLALGAIALLARRRQVVR